MMKENNNSRLMINLPILEIKNLLKNQLKIKNFKKTFRENTLIMIIETSVNTHKNNTRETNRGILTIIIITIIEKEIQEIEIKVETTNIESRNTIIKVEIKIILEITIRVEWKIINNNINITIGKDINKIIIGVTIEIITTIGIMMVDLITETTETKILFIITSKINKEEVIKVEAIIWIIEETFD